MGNLFVFYTDENNNGAEVFNVDGKDLLACLAQLHEHLNAVVMVPGKYQNPSYGVSADTKFYPDGTYTTGTGTGLDVKPKNPTRG